MCASEQCFAWGRKPCSVLYPKRLLKLAKANTYRYPIMSIVRAWHCRRFTIVMEESETSVAAVSVLRGGDGIVEGSGVSLDLTEEGRR